MKMPLVIYCVEDPLSRSILERLFEEYCSRNIISKEILEKEGGIGKIEKKENFQKLFECARRDPVLILIDLDNCKCPPTCRRYWIQKIWKKEKLPEKMFLCIAEVEAESWVLADRENFSEFVGIKKREIPRDVENHRKEDLLDLIKKSKKPDIKRILPQSNERVGSFYNPVLGEFIKEKWDPNLASKNSPSLEYLIKKLKKINKDLGYPP